MTARSLSCLPNFRRKAGLDALKDFTPPTSLLTFVFYPMVHTSTPGRTLAEVIAHIQANPDSHAAEFAERLETRLGSFGKAIERAGLPVET